MALFSVAAPHESRCGRMRAHILFNAFVVPWEKPLHSVFHRLISGCCAMPIRKTEDAINCGILEWKTQAKLLSIDRVPYAWGQAAHSQVNLKNLFFSSIGPVLFYFLSAFFLPLFAAPLEPADCRLNTTNKREGLELMRKGFQPPWKGDLGSWMKPWVQLFWLKLQNASLQRPMTC